MNVNYEINNYYRNNSNNFYFKIGNLTLYVSYKTIIAFYTPHTGLIVCKNVFSNTTGKHLNSLPEHNKNDRLDYNIFQQRLSHVLNNFIEMM